MNRRSFTLASLASLASAALGRFVPRKKPPITPEVRVPETAWHVETIRWEPHGEVEFWLDGELVHTAKLSDEGELLEPFTVKTCPGEVFNLSVKDDHRSLCLLKSIEESA